MVQDYVDVANNFDTYLPSTLKVKQGKRNGSTFSKRACEV